MKWPILSRIVAVAVLMLMILRSSEIHPLIEPTGQAEWIRFGNGFRTMIIGKDTLIIIKMRVATTILLMSSEES